MSALASLPARPAKTSARILIVDDHPLVRDGLRARIEAGGWEVCGEAADIPTALRLAEELQPDVAIVDLSLNGGTCRGLDLIKRLRDRCPGLKMLVCSMHDEQMYGERVLQAGAQGFLPKHAASRELVSAVTRLLNGQLYASPAIVQNVLLRSVGRSSNPQATPVERLTDRELEVFEGLGRGSDIQELSEAMNLSRKTVETYRDRIKKKLQLTSSHQLTHYAIRWAADRGQ